MIQPEVLINTGRSKLWIAKGYSPYFFSQLKQVPLYEDHPIMVMGRECKQRRNVGFFF